MAYFENCWVLTRSFSTEVLELKSNQEESDTCLVLHTKHTYDSCGK